MVWIHRPLVASPFTYIGVSRDIERGTSGLSTPHSFGSLRSLHETRERRENDGRNEGNERVIERDRMRMEHNF